MAEIKDLQDQLAVIRQEIKAKSKKKVSENFKIIGNNIKQLRKRDSINQEELADSLGFSRTQICNIERGESRTTTTVIYLLCDYFKVTPNDIMLKEYKG